MPRSALDKLYGIVDQQEADRQAQEDRIKNDPIAHLLPASMRERRAARLSGTPETRYAEDPRVTAYYKQLESPVNDLLPSSVRKARQERLTNRFYEDNPEYDPRLANEKVKVGGQEKGADETLQQILRMAVAANTDDVSSLQSLAMAREAAKQYDRIKDQISPALRKKYNLDAFEQAGIFEMGETSIFSKDYWKQGAAEFVTTPGIKQVLHELGKPQQFATASLAGLWQFAGGLKNGEFNEGDLKDAARAAFRIGDPRSYMSDDALREEVSIHDNNGDGILDLRDALDSQPDASGNRNIGPGTYGEWSGVPTDAVNRLAEFGWSVFSDPTARVSMAQSGRARAGFAALEREGLADVVRQIRKTGWNSLDEVQQAAAREAIERSVASAIAAGATDTGQASAIEKALLRGGQSGVRFGGRTILPTRYTGGSTTPVESALTKVTSRLLPSEVGEGTIITSFGDATVISRTENTLTVKPSSVVEVVRDGTPVPVRPSEIQVGDELLNGDYTVRSVGKDGTVELKAARGLQHIERPLDVIPQHQNGSQGEMFAPDTRPAEPPVDGDPRRIGQSPEPGYNVRLSDIGREPRPMDQGTLFDGLGKAAGQPAARQADLDALAAAPDVGNAAGERAVEAATRHIDDELPKRPGSQKVLSPDVVAFGVRGENGELLGFARIQGMFEGNPNIELIHTTPAGRGQGVAQQILRDIEAAGLDLNELIRNSEFTEQGRALFERYLRAGDDVAETVVDAPAQQSLLPAGDDGKAPPPVRDEPINDQATAIVPTGPRRKHKPVTVRRPTGGTQQLRPWYSRGNKRPIEEGWEILSGDVELGSVVRYTDDGTLILTPGRALEGAEVGDLVPELGGRIVKIDAEGVHILPEEAAGRVFGKQRVLLKGEPAVSPAAASEDASGVITPGAPSEAQGGGILPEPGASSDDAVRATLREPVGGGYGPDALDQIEKARIQAGRVEPATEEAQQRLFDRGVVDINEVQPADRLPALGGEFIEKTGTRTFRAQLDDKVRTVVRDGVTERIDLDSLDVGDEIPEIGVKVVGKNADGTFELRANLGGEGTEIRTTIGGLAQSKPGLIGRAGNTKAGQVFTGLFKPRGNIQVAERLDPTRVAPGTSEAVYRATSARDAATANLESEMQALTRGGWELLQEDLKGEALATLRRALDVADSKQTRQVIGELELAGKVKAAEGVRRFLKARDMIREFEGAYKMSDELFDTASGRLPLILTDEGQKLLQTDELVRRRLLGDKRLDNLSKGFDFTDELGGARLRIEPNDARGTWIDVDFAKMSADEINRVLTRAISEDARKALGLADGDLVKVFETNPMTVYAMRGRTSFANAMEAEMLTELAKPFANQPGIVRLATADDEIYRKAQRIFAAGGKGADTGAATRSLDDIVDELMAEEGLQRLRGYESPVGAAYAQPEVAHYLSTLREIVVKEENLKKLSQVARKLNSTWARLRTSPITKGVGFQARNLTSNSISSIVRGIADGFVDQLPFGADMAVKVMRGTKKAMKLVEEEGLRFEEAIEQAITDPQVRNAALSARANGIVKEGFFRNLSYDDQALETAIQTSRKDKFKARLNPFSQEFIITKPGQKLNEVAEDFSRLTHYYAVLQATGSVDEAIRSTRDTLFDYSDLTQFERSAAKSVNRFYTFMRKNLGLQLALFAQHPGLMANVQRQIGGLYGNPAGVLYPGEGQDGEAKAAGGFLNMLVNNGNPGAVRLDTPLDAALKTIDPFAQAAIYAIPGLSETMPLSERPTPKSITEGLFGLTAGGPTEALDILYSWRTGQDVRTGRPMSPTGGVRDKLTDFFLPIWDQGHTSAEDVQTRAGILRLLAGIAYYDRSSEDTKTSLLYAQSRELEELLAILKAQGVETPTISELRDAGLLPSASEYQEKGPRTVPMPEEVRRDRARSALGY